MKVLKNRSAHDTRIIISVTIAMACFVVGFLFMECDNTCVSFCVAMAGLMFIYAFVYANEDRWSRKCDHTEK